MKNVIILSFLMLSIFSVNAQEKDETTDNNLKKNEVKINALFLILGGFDVTYERLLNEESGVGITVFLPISSNTGESVNYYISPYYRFYFGEKYAAGFFVEGFGMLNSINEETFVGFDVAVEDETITDFALGVGFGGKWITSRNVTFELSLGIGRNLFNSSDGENEIVGKGGIIIGYRF